MPHTFLVVKKKPPLGIDASLVCVEGVYALNTLYTSIKIINIKANIYVVN